jgi:hypothetical protein
MGGGWDRACAGIAVIDRPKTTAGGGGASTIHIKPYANQYTCVKSTPIWDGLG